MESLIRRTFFLIVLIIAASRQFSHAEIIYVPDDFPAVQAALDATQNGDTVLLQPGTYREILFIPGHDVTLAGIFLLSSDTNDVARCILRPPAEAASGRCVYALESGVTALLHVVGLTIGGGVSSTTRQLGGMEINNRSLVMTRCVLDSSYAVRGKAIQ